MLRAGIIEEDLLEAHHQMQDVKYTSIGGLLCEFFRKMWMLVDQDMLCMA